MREGEGRRRRRGREGKDIKITETDMFSKAQTSYYLLYQKQVMNQPSQWISSVGLPVLLFLASAKCLRRICRCGCHVPSRTF
jgi:hypothetical protein